MIPYAEIHGRIMNSKWTDLEKRGLSRPADDNENTRRLRESRMDVEDVCAEAISNPSKLSSQALQTPIVVSSMALASSKTDAVVADPTSLGSSPADISTSLKTNGVPDGG